MVEEKEAALLEQEQLRQQAESIVEEKEAARLEQEQLRLLLRPFRSVGVPQSLFAARIAFIVALICWRLATVSQPLLTKRSFES